MTETMERNTLLREAEQRELDLRRERAQMPQWIADASWVVQDLRGDGHHDGDSPELEAAVQEVRELTARERALPALIIAAVAARCRLRGEQLAAEESALAEEYEQLQAAAAKARRTAEQARRKVAAAKSRAEGAEMLRERIRQEARPLEDFVRAAEEAEEAEKKLRLLEQAKVEGLMLPFTDARSVES
jgi:hypothetical protein